MWPTTGEPDRRAPVMMTGDRVRFVPDGDCTGARRGVAQGFYADGTMIVEWNDGTKSTVMCCDVRREQ
jgi:hypothetical protein